MGQRSVTENGESRSVHLSLDVLEFLARAGRSAALAEITDAVEAPKATIHRLLATLHARGYVSQEDRSGHYGMGIRCFELGSLWAQGLDLRVIAAPHVRRLNERTGEMVHLALYEHGDVIYIDKLDGHHPVVPRSHVGRRCPAYCVSTGRALLAFMPSEEIERVLSGPLPAHTERTLTDPGELRALLAEVRRTGYAVNEGSYREGVCGVGAVVRDHTGSVVASIGTCVPDTRFAGERFEKLRDETLNAAAAVSAELGWVLAPPSPGAQRPLNVETAGPS